MTADVYSGDVVTLTALLVGRRFELASGGDHSDRRLVEGISGPRRAEHRVLGPQDAAIHRPDALQLSGRSGGPRGVMMKRSNTWDGTWTANPQFTINPTTRSERPRTARTSIARASCRTSGNTSGCRRSTIIRTDSLYPTFMYSRDAAHWSFPDPYQPIIDLSAHGQNRQTTSAWRSRNLVDRQGRLAVHLLLVLSR